MENRSHALAVGIFVLLLVGGIVFAFMWFSDDKVPQTPYYVVTSSAVSGLSEGSDVRVRGLKVGKIVNFQFNPANRQEVLIKILVNSDIPVTRGTYAKIVYQGITGQGAIELDEPPTPSKPLHSSEDHLAMIPMRPSILENVTTYARELFKRTEKILVQLDRLLNDNNIQALSATFAAAQKTTEKLPDFIDSLEKTNQTLQHALAKVDNLVNDDIQGAVNDVREAVNGVNNAAESIQSLSGEGKTLFQNLNRQTMQLSGSVETDVLPRINSTLEELSQTSEALKYLMNNLRENPASLFLGVKKSPGPGEPGFNQGEEK